MTRSFVFFIISIITPALCSQTFYTYFLLPEPDSTDAGVLTLSVLQLVHLFSPLYNSSHVTITTG